MKTKLKKIITSRWLQLLLYYLIRLYSRTFRLTIENEEKWMTFFKNGGRVLLCTWHQQFFSAIRYFKNYQVYTPALMISQSIDGDIVAGVAELTGWYPVRGSSSKDGKQALVAMINRLKKTGLAAHVVDGPRGPIGKVKAGTIRLALAADAVIVPFYVTADRAWFFNSWDKFFIPKPYARVALRFDNMIDLSTPESEADFEAQRQKVEDIMIKELKGM